MSHVRAEGWFLWVVLWVVSAGRQAAVNRPKIPFQMVKREVISCRCWIAVSRWRQGRKESECNNKSAEIGIIAGRRLDNVVKWITYFIPATRHGDISPNVNRKHWAPPGDRNRFITRSRRRMGWWEFSARLFSPRRTDTTGS